MPSTAADLRSRPPVAPRLSAPGNLVEGQPSPRFATGLLLALTRLASGAKSEPAPASVEAGDVTKRPSNLCEFDYDYYVTLQKRRGHQPARLNRASQSFRRE